VEDATGAQRLPHRRLVERRQRGVRLVGELGRVGVVDRHPQRRGEVVGLGRPRGSDVAGRRALGDLPQPGREPGGSDAPTTVAPRSGALGSARADGGAADRGAGTADVGADRVRARPLGGDPAGDVLLEHGVEVGAAEAERGHPGGADLPGAWGPLGELGVDPERCGSTSRRSGSACRS
jgi:hypothetical protein